MGNKLWQNPPIVWSDVGREHVASGPVVVWAWQEQQWELVYEVRLEIELREGPVLDFGCEVVPLSSKGFLLRN